VLEVHSFGSYFVPVHEQMSSTNKEECMKRVLLLFSVVVLVIGLMFAQTQESKGEKIQLALSGLHCGGCVKNVEQALRSVVGVKSVTVHQQESTAEVLLASANVTSDALIKAVNDAGYGAELRAAEKTGKKAQADECCAMDGDKKKEDRDRKEDDCCKTDSKSRKSNDH
jgi:copper chaperone CopZ